MASSSQTIILITGANQGLGLEVVKQLSASTPNHTILLGSRDLSKGKSAASSVDSSKLASNTTVTPVQVDVTSDSSIDAAVSHLTSTYGRLDILFNNAGIMSSPPSSREDHLKVYNTNVAGTDLLTRACIPLLRKSSSPRILMMSSDLGSVTRTLDPESKYYGINGSAYTISKAAMNMLAALYAVEYKKEGFQVIVINPGYRATNLNSHSQYAGKAEDGAIEAVRVIREGKDMKSGTFTEIEGEIPW